MEVLLKKTIDTLGREGELVNVKPGYARNYLIPQKLAVTVNKASLARLQKEQEAITKRLEEERKNAKDLAARIDVDHHDHQVIAQLDHIFDVGHVIIGDLRDVHQTIFTRQNGDKCTEVHNLTHWRTRRWRNLY